MIFQQLKKKKGDSRALGNPIPKSVHYSGQGTKSYRENMMVLKGEFDLIPGHSEDEVRS